jgi:hypothetical protein
MMRRADCYLHPSTLGRSLRCTPPTYSALFAADGHTTPQVVGLVNPRDARGARKTASDTCGVVRRYLIEHGRARVTCLARSAAVRVAVLAVLVAKTSLSLILFHAPPLSALIQLSLVGWTWDTNEVVN